MSIDGWDGPDGDLGRFISFESGRSLDAYRAQPNLVDEHASVEWDTAGGGYQHRQLFELVQNGADALWIDTCTGDGDAETISSRGRIEVRLTAEYLYCADDGEPIDADGVKALMFSRLSPKRGTNQIGTFGLGFKALLGVSVAPEFFSRSGSFRFDRTRSQDQIRALAPDAEQFPVLRLAEPIDPGSCWIRDAVLRDLMGWAANIVRLPLRHGARDDLYQQMMDFPAKFLLFVPHVGSLTFVCKPGGMDRVMELEKVHDVFRLSEGDSISEWRLFRRMHRLSKDARANRRRGDERDEVPVWWAAPVARLDRRGKFWAFFPTYTENLVPGILNAPWKTNEDRQNLLAGPYNEELIRASAEMIVDALPLIRTEDDPARHLDALPRRKEHGDSDQANLLRDCLFASLYEREILPDQNGVLRRAGDLSYPPRLSSDTATVTALYERWASNPGRPDGWLHHKALSPSRIATIDRMFQASNHAVGSRAPRASVADWLEALAQDAEPDHVVAASMAAIQTAARVPSSIRGARLGRIVLTESGGWCAPDPAAVFLPSGSSIADTAADPGSIVKVELAADRETSRSLEKLGIASLSPEARFKAIAESVIATPSDRPAAADLHKVFWKASRDLGADDAEAVIRSGVAPVWWTVRDLLSTGWLGAPFVVYG